MKTAGMGFGCLMAALAAEGMDFAFPETPGLNPILLALVGIGLILLERR